MNTETEEIKTEEEPFWKIRERQDAALVAMSREDYDKMMVAKFPDIFANRFKPMNQTCMCWGFDVGPGWYPLLYDMCVKLDFLGKKLGFTVVADQIKEKYASLRFYHHIDGYVEPGTAGATMSAEELSIASDIVDDIVADADRALFRTCEECGEVGELHIQCGWHVTLCDAHAKEREDKMCKPDVPSDPIVPDASNEG